MALSSERGTSAKGPPISVAAPGARKTAKSAEASRASTFNIKRIFNKYCNKVGAYSESKTKNVAVPSSTKLN